MRLKWSWVALGAIVAATALGFLGG